MVAGQKNKLQPQEYGWKSEYFLIKVAGQKIKLQPQEYGWKSEYFFVEVASKLLMHILLVLVSKIFTQVDSA